MSFKHKLKLALSFVSGLVFAGAAIYLAVNNLPFLATVADGLAMWAFTPFIRHVMSPAGADALVPRQ